MSSVEAAQRTEAWDAALHAYGTFAVFKERIRKLRWRRYSRDFTGVAVPLCVGFVLGSLGGRFQTAALSVLSFLALVQILITVWSYIAKWDDTYFYALTAARENETISGEWELIAKSSEKDLAQKIATTRAADNVIKDRDSAEGVSDKERRFGMRSALLYRRKTCVNCGKMPSDMKATDCPVCGNF